MNLDLLALIKSCKIFSSLDDKTLNDLLPEFEVVNLKKNQTLFKQGDTAHYFYLVVVGKISIILKKENSAERILNEVLPGDTLGEFSALSHEPSSVTARAMDKSVLLKLSSEAFYDLCHKNPIVIFETVNKLIERSRTYIDKLSSPEDIGKKHVLFVAANSNISLEKFYEVLRSQLKGKSNFYLLYDQDPAANKKFDTEVELANYIDSIEGKKTIIYIAESHQSKIAKIAYRKADAIYVVAYSNSKHHLDPFIQKKLNTYSFKPELVVLHEDQAELPKHTSRWYKLIHFSMHHHIRLNKESDFQRLIRFIQGVAVGLVLGGGGLKCWAHLGAIKALTDAGIPIDIVGGTSAGAIVGGYYSMHVDNNASIKPLQKLSDVTSQSTSWRNLTWPAVSLFDGKDYTAEQQKIFKSVRIENLWTQSFFISCSLADNTEIIHKRGLLWKAIRSSTAVPAIYPPVISKGKLHLDGGILNNLPVDVMRKIIGPKGIIIAVELTHYHKDTKEYNFPPSLTFWPTMLAKMKITKKNYNFPSFVELFLSSLLAGASAKQFMNSVAADILISPDLSKYKLLSVTRREQIELMNLGYDSGVKAIKKWKRKSRIKSQKIK